MPIPQLHATEQKNWVSNQLEITAQEPQGVINAVHYCPFGQIHCWLQEKDLDWLGRCGWLPYTLRPAATYDPLIV
jgi:hypothetical protein